MTTTRTDTHVEWRFPEGRYLEFSGRLNYRDLLELNLDHVDRFIVNEPIISAADMFQSLEIIFRRMQQQAAVKPPAQPQLPADKSQENTAIPTD